MANLSYSSVGLGLTKQFEGCRLTAYRDSGGVLTIGYGHIGPDVRVGMTITSLQAEELLQSDVASAVACVNELVTTTINQNQFDALVDFTFNLGCGNLKASKLLQYVNKRNFAQAATEFPRWNEAGGKEVDGLTRRRQAEMELFNTPVTPAKENA